MGAALAKIQSASDNKQMLVDHYKNKIQALEDKMKESHAK
jgi:hypothetical protein